MTLLGLWNNLNLPNKITLLRLGLAVIYLLILLVITEVGTEGRGLLWIAFGIFLTAVVTDILDGYFARRLGIETSLGRVLDPLVDKIMICGSLVFFLGFPHIPGYISHWMVVFVIVRELVVHDARMMIEQRRGVFGSTFWGKQKMFFQSFAVGAVLLYEAQLSHYTGLGMIVAILLWVMVLSTLISAIPYFARIGSFLAQEKL
jgi:CDP-diacylglycerol--glycerol-3-phosphate 3-phosphatidyltransferase